MKHVSIISPSMVLQTGGEPLNVYCRFGIGLPVYTKIKGEFIGSYPDKGNFPNFGLIEDIRFQVKNYFRPGFVAAMGASYKMSNKFNIWGEINTLSMSLYKKQEEITSYLVNGLPAQYPSPTTMNYYKSGNYYSISTITEPTSLKPFSNIGITAGIAYKFSKRLKTGGK